MKHIFTIISFFVLGITAVTAQLPENVDIKAVSGNGFRFWDGNNRFKIHMGIGSEYQYGPVQDYSIKSNMDGGNGVTRGWTWGGTGKTPIAGLNTVGDFQIARNFIAKGYARVGDGNWGALIVDGKDENNWLLNAHNDANYFHIRTQKNGGTPWSSVIMSMNRHNGNVGIGNTTPQNKLSVNGTIYSSSGLKTGASESEWYWNMYREGDPSNIANEDLVFATKRDPGDVEKTRMVLTEQGSLGINTNNPIERLHVKNGTASIEGDIGVPTSSYWKTENHNLELQNNDSGEVVLSFHSAGKSNAAIVHGTSGGLIFAGAGNPTDKHMYVGINGNVGIGTITPQNKLSVNGTIWAQEVLISLTDAADWVFEDDYNLKPLAEVEQYIKTNKHLPEIPSAEEFRENDLKVSEMTNKLLQKIEELTLYTIEQEKKLQDINELKEENKKLAARLANIEALLVK